jgi:hypothetical protein
MKIVHLNKKPETQKCGFRLEKNKINDAHVHQISTHSHCSNNRGIEKYRVMRILRNKFYLNKNAHESIIEHA